MLDYLIKTEIHGIEIRVLYSKAPDKYYVIYGVQVSEHGSCEDAMSEYINCVEHAW